MSNLNNFNICPRCNTPNPMVAKFCFQCGTQLKSPDTPVVCSKCNTVNTGRSSYCKTCGNKLVGGTATKICPRCSNNVNANSAICDKCGYAFSTTGSAFPKNGAHSAKVASASLAQQAIAQRAQKGKVKVAQAGGGKSKGRAAGFFAIVLALAAAYFLLMPPFIAVGSWDFGFIKINGSPFSGWKYIVNIINNISSVVSSSSVWDWVILGVFALTLLTVVVEFFSGFVQLISGRRAKRSKGLLLAVMFITVFAAAFANLVQYGAQIAEGSTSFLADIFVWFSTLKHSRLGAVSVGLLFDLCAAYMFVAYIFSLFFKISKKDQKVLHIER